MDNPNPEHAYFKQARLFALLLVVIFPLVYLVIALLISPDEFTDDDSDRLVLYMLMLVAMIQPTAYYLFRKIQVSNYKRSQQAKMSPGQLFLTLEIMKLALIEAVFIYGLVMIFLSGKLIDLVYFYIIGIIWSIVLWPRRSAMETFIKNLEEHGT